MSRPGDWSALDLGSDPVPGAADQVSAEATHYTQVAQTISSQVSRLRRLAEGDASLRGEYSEALRESCEELAGDLDKAYGRFETVGEELSKLSTPLETALHETNRALEQAVDAQGRLRGAAGEGYSPGMDVTSEDGELDPTLVAARRRYDDAERDLAAARTRCATAVAAWEGVADPAAARIRAASDDDLKDGWFDGLKAWVKRNAAWLKELSTWLGRIVLVLAVVILLVSNPAGWIVALALVSSVALLAVDALLAVAGEGSWTDVLMDVISVATLGGGAVLARMARFGRSLSLFKAARVHGLRSGMQTLRNAFNNPGLLGGLRNVVNVVRPSSYSNAVRDGVRVARHIRSTPLVSSPLAVRTLLYGREAMTLSDDLARIAAQNGQQVVSRLHEVGVAGTRTMAGVATVNTGLDNLMDAGLGPFGSLDGLTDRLTTREVGAL